MRWIFIGLNNCQVCLICTHRVLKIGVYGNLIINLKKGRKWGIRVLQDGCGRELPEEPSLAKTCERTKLFGCHMHLFGILLQLFILIPN